MHHLQYFASDKRRGNFFQNTFFAKNHKKTKIYLQPNLGCFYLLHMR